MTTQRQIKKLVAPLLEQHSSLILVDGIVYLKPVDHVLLAIIFDRTGEAKRVRPLWVITHYCRIFRYFPVVWDRMIGSPGNNLWYWDDPTMPARFVAKIEDEILPLLRKLQRFDEFVTLVSSDFFLLQSLRASHLEHAVITAAYGDFEKTKSICADLIAGRTRFSLPYFKQPFDRVTKELYPLVLAGDHASVASLLHEWEAISMRNFGLEKIWEPTPFPLEMK